MVFICPRCGAVLKPLVEEGRVYGFRCTFCGLRIDRKRARQTAPSYFRSFDPVRLFRNLRRGGLCTGYRRSTCMKDLYPTLRSLGILRRDRLTPFGRELRRLENLEEFLELLRQDLGNFLEQCTYLGMGGVKSRMEAERFLKQLNRYLGVLTRQRESPG